MAQYIRINAFMSKLYFYYYNLLLQTNILTAFSIENFCLKLCYLLFQMDGY